MNYITTDSELISIASAIRAKTSSASSLIYPSGFIDGIANISGGIDTSEATATPSDILLGKTAYVNDIKIIGTIDFTDATATSSNLLLGKTAYTGNGEITGTIALKSAEIYEVSSVDRVIAAGQYLTGPQTIKGTGPNIRQNMEDPVRFFDYDGTLLYSYSSSDFLALSEMPANPSHTDMGITAQGWNWSLSDAQAQVSAMEYCDIGQLYTTISGATELDIELVYPLKIYLYGKYESNSTGSVEIDWGDGSAHGYIYGTGGDYHSYQPGNYTIKMYTTNEQTKWYFQQLSGGYAAYSEGHGINYRQCGTRNTLKAIRFGSRCTGASSGSFYGCNQIRYITFSNEITRMSIDNSNTSYMKPQTIICAPGASLSMGGNYNGLRILAKNITITNYIYGEGRLVIPYGITTINYYFRGFSEIILPPTLTETGLDTFKTSNLKHIKFTSPHVFFYSYPFRECYNLKTLDLPASFSFSEYGYSAFAYCSRLDFDTIPIAANQSSIGISMFEGNVDLQQVVIPSSITYIGQRAFRGCTHLKSVTIPDSVAVISGGAFSQCQTLIGITIPSSVITIGGEAFSYCSAMEEIHFKSTTPPTLGTNVFQGWKSRAMNGGRIYVPTGTLADYQSAPSYPSTSTFEYIEE